MNTTGFKLSRRWLIFITASALFTLSQFYRSSVAVISPDLIQELGLNAWELSTVSASFFYAFALMQIPVGIFLDSSGPKISMTALTIIAAVGAFVFAAGTSYHHLTIGRVLLGAGMACNFMGTLKLLTMLFEPRYFATLSAVVVSVATAGNIAAATPLVLMVQCMGWRSSFISIGGVTLIITLIFFFLSSDRPGSDPIKYHQKKSRTSIKDTIKKAKRLFTRKDFWIIAFSTFCRYGIFASVQALWAGPYLMKAIGLSPVSAGNIILLMSIGIIVCSPLSGTLSDHIIHSRKKIIIPGLFGMASVLFILVFLPDETGKLPLFLLFFFFGVFSSTGQIMYAHIKEQVPLENAGLAMTGINFFTMAGVAVFLQGMGSIMEHFYPGASLSINAFRTTFAILGACLTVTGIFYFFTKETL